MGIRDLKLVRRFIGASSQEASETPAPDQKPQPEEIDPANPTSIDHVLMFRSHLISIKDAPGYTHMMILMASVKSGLQSGEEERPLLRQINIMVKNDGEFEFVDQLPGMDFLVANILDGCAHLQAWEKQHGPDFDDAYLVELNERKKTGENKPDAVIPPHHSVVSALARAAGMKKTPPESALGEFQEPAEARL